MIKAAPNGFIGAVHETKSCSSVKVTIDGGLIDIEQDGEIIEMTPTQVIELRRILYETVLES